MFTVGNRPMTQAQEREREPSVVVKAEQVPHSLLGTRGIWLCLRSFNRRVRCYPPACERTDTKATQTAPPQAVNNYIQMSGTELARGRDLKEQWEREGEPDIQRHFHSPFIRALLQVDFDKRNEE